jgi:imidazolonepropionase-like amidohydrolase
MRPPVLRAGPLAAAALPLLLIALPAHGQERALDRRKWTDSTTTTSDDPRRIPMPPGSRVKGTIVLKGGRVFDGTGAAARAGTVVISGNRIAKVLAPGATDWPADARVLDVTGRTVLPGLIDMHTHLTYIEPGLSPDVMMSTADATLRAVERMRFYLESGITSVRDVASGGDVPFRLKAWVAEGRLAGPRVFPAGQIITGLGGHGDDVVGPPDKAGAPYRVASGPDDWREAVREQFKRGADVIKVASHFSREEVAAAVEEAHALGLRITCDCETFYIDWAVAAGVDMIEHPLPRSEEAIRAMASRGVASIPTLIPYIYIFDLWGGYFGNSSRRFTFSKAANLEMLRKLKAAGITLGVGTDLVVDWFRFLPAPYITELEQFVAVGFTPAEALQAATRTNATLLDMGDRLGTLEAGKLADLLVVKGEPDKQLRDLANVDLVIRDGEVVVQDGRVMIPRHLPLEPKPAKP